MRDIQPEDAPELLQLMLVLDQETTFMMYEEGERKPDMNRINQLIQAAVEGDHFLYVAENNKTIVGFISAQRGEPKRIRHTAYIVVGIRKAFWGQGLGTRFFEALDEWAKENGVTRLELTVMCHNKTAFALYQKCGFLVEGTKKNSMYVNGAYVDEYYLSKLLDTN